MAPITKLAQKYRPGKFSDVIGQVAAVEVLRAVIRQRRYGSAYLFSGPTGTGKTTLGRIFSKAILCDSPVDGDPCGVCESCKLFENDQHFSFMEMDSASVGGKDDMIKLRDEAAFLSVSKKKIILLDECHDISKQGQDALLEQVERCPEHLVYIFCTTASDKMQKPLLQRCMHFQFLKVDPNLISQRIKYICEQEKFEYEKEALDLIALRSEGHVRNAINLLEEVVYLGTVTVKNINIVSRDFDEEIFEILSNLGTDLVKVMAASRKVAACLSASEFYSQLIGMVNDTAKAVFGYEEFSGKRKELILKLKEIHGSSILEFLNYLISRDKFIDKVGLQSDLVVMHYKFNSNNFIPRTQKELPSNIAPQINSQTSEPSKEAPPSLTYAELSKLGILEKAKVLRQSRNQKVEQREDQENVPVTWPLLKEERIGESSLDEVYMSPQEFSQNLVGGRGGGKLANS